MTAGDAPRTLAGTVVVLVRTTGPVNIGLTCRVAANLGAAQVRLVNPQCEVNCVDSRKFANHAKDAVLQMPVFATLDEALADRDLVVGTSARPRDATDHGQPISVEALPALAATRKATRIALVFGNEQHGLDADELRRCQVLLHLDTPGDYPSYNLSHAVAITLYALHRAMLVHHGMPMEPTGGDSRHNDQAAAQVTIERLYEHWITTLERFRYFRRTDQERFAPQLRALMNRLHFSEHDAHVLWGMLSQFGYVLNELEGGGAADAVPSPFRPDAG